MTVESITRAAGTEGERVLGVPVDATGPVVDPVGAADPLARLPGWLLDHVSFLREPLTALRGDPDEINANAATLRSAARDMLAIAKEQANGEMATLGLALDATAAIAVITGKLVHALRGIVFGIISALVTDLARGAMIATATASHTAGGSIAVFVGAANARATATATLVRDRIAALMSALDRQAGRLAELENLMAALEFERA